MTNLMNMNNNLGGKYYVFAWGCQGASYDELMAQTQQAETNEVFDNYEDAKNMVDYLWETELAPDEICYLIHPDGHYEEL